MVNDNDIFDALLRIVRDQERRIRELNASISVLRNVVKLDSNREDRARADALGANEPEPIRLLAQLVRARKGTP